MSARPAIPAVASAQRSREAATAPGEPGMEAFTKAAGSAYTRGHVRGFKLGDGSFSLLTNIYELPTHENLDLYWVCGFNPPHPPFSPLTNVYQLDTHEDLHLYWVCGFEMHL